MYDEAKEEIKNHLNIQALSRNKKCKIEINHCFGFSENCLHLLHWGDRTTYL